MVKCAANGQLDGKKGALAVGGNTLPRPERWHWNLAILLPWGPRSAHCQRSIRKGGEETMQTNELAFEGYVRNLVNELSGPLESILPALAPESTAFLQQLPNAGHLIFYDFWLLFLNIAGADHHIKSKEAEVLQDICQALSIAFDSKLLGEGQTLRQYFRTIIEPAPDASGPTEATNLLTLRALQAYDGVHGTSYLEKAKSLFYLFAETLVMADAQVSAEEEARLTAFKELLWPTRDDTKLGGEKK
jgi:hypothetical protein